MAADATLRGSPGAAAAAASIARRETSAREVALAALDRIALRDGEVRAWAHVDPDLVLEQADRIDRAVSTGPLGALAGVLVGVKDLIDTADLPTAYGADRYRGHQPESDAACVTSLRVAGALVAGKTVTTELALWSPPPTRNPLRSSRTPGGSSAGSAASVADFMVPVSIGTQTAGSVIRPASYCGVLGFVPTCGRWDRAGIKPVSPSLDRVGVFARTVDDVRLVAAALDGASSHAASDADAERRWRFGLMSDLDHAVPGLRSVLERLGEVRVVDSSPLLEEGAALHDTIMRREMRGALRAEIDDPLGLTDPTRAYLESLQDESYDGDCVEVGHRLKACRRRVDAVLGEFDVVVTSSAAGEAPPAAEGTGDPVYCRLWSLMGLPSLSLPACEGPSGMPVGVQLVGRRRADATVLDAGESLEAKIRQTGQLQWSR